MKRLFLLLLSCLWFAAHANAQNGILQQSNYRINAKSNSQYEIIITSFFADGSGPCFSFLGYDVRKSNDSVYLNAYYDTRAIAAALGCARIDTILYSNPFLGINYIHLATKEITYDRHVYLLVDTLSNRYDSTFRITPTTVRYLNQGNNLYHFYPNPSDKELMIDNLTGQIDYFRLSNMQGQLVCQKAVASGKNIISVSDFPSGFYYLCLKTKSGDVFSEKILIAH